MSRGAGGGGAGRGLFGRRLRRGRGASLRGSDGRYGVGAFERLDSLDRRNLQRGMYRPLLGELERSGIGQRHHGLPGAHGHPGQRRVWVDPHQDHRRPDVRCRLGYRHDRLLPGYGNLVHAERRRRHQPVRQCLPQRDDLRLQLRRSGPLFRQPPPQYESPPGGLRVDQRHVEHDEQPVAQLHAGPHDGCSRRDRERHHIIGLVGLGHREPQLRIHRRRRLLRRPGHAPVEPDVRPARHRLRQRIDDVHQRQRDGDPSRVCVRAHGRQHLLLGHTHDRHPAQQLGRLLVRNVRRHV